MKTLLLLVVIFSTINKNKIEDVNDNCSLNINTISNAVKNYGNIKIQKKNSEYKWDVKLTFENGTLKYQQKVFVNNIYSSESIYSVLLTAIDKNNIKIEVSKENNIIISLKTKNNSNSVVEKTIVKGLPSIENHNSYLDIGLTKNSLDQDLPNEVRKSFIYLIENCAK